MDAWPDECKDGGGMSTLHVELLLARFGSADDGRLPAGLSPLSLVAVALSPELALTRRVPRGPCRALHWPKILRHLKQSEDF